MAINQLNPTTNDIAKLITNVVKAYKSQADITLTNYDNNSAPQVTAGSIFANNGASFENTALATPTGYSGITNSTTFYLYYDESGGVFIFSNTAPTFSDAKQGWYNGNDRAFFSMFKDSGGTLYVNKSLMINKSTNQIAGNIVTSGAKLVTVTHVWDSADTENTVYDAFASFLPYDEIVLCTGQFGSGVVINRIIKVSASSKLTIWANANDAALDIRDGNGTAMGTDGVITF